MKRINKAKPLDRRRNLRILYAEQHGFCFYCWEPTALIDRTNGPVPPNAATLDHLQPLDKGGGNRIENLVLACHRCNTHRSSRCWREFAQEQANVNRYLRYGPL